MAHNAETRDLRDLSALADGTLDPARRAEVHARISASPELTALYERERRIADALREIRASDRAPAHLRARIEAQRSSRRRIPVRLRPSYGAALAGAVAVALLLVLVLPAGTPIAPSVAQADQLAVRGSQGPAPADDPDSRGARLNMNIENVYFPDWTKLFWWRAIGQRIDHLNGRLVKTVYYERHGHQVAYTIVGAPALKSPPAKVYTYAHSTAYLTLTLHGRLVVTWRRDGHTCVLSGTNVSGSLLEQLAATEPSGS